MIVFKNVSVAKNNNQILSDVNLTIEPEIITAIIGANASGKSSLINCFLKNMKIDSGKINYLNQEVTDQTSYKVHQDTALLMQVNQFATTMYVSDYLKLSALNNRGIFRRFTTTDAQNIQKAVEICEIENLVNYQLGHLSGGQRQRVFLAFCLAQNPKLLILDEPATYLDITNQIKLLKIIKKVNLMYKMTIILIHHDIEQAINISDQLVLMDQSKIIFKRNSKNIKDFGFIKQYFKLECDIKQTNNMLQINYMY